MRSYFPILNDITGGSLAERVCVSALSAAGPCSKQRNEYCGRGPIEGKANCRRRPSNNVLSGVCVGCNYVENSHFTGHRYRGLRILYVVAVQETVQPVITGHLAVRAILCAYHARQRTDRVLINLNSRSDSGRSHPLLV